MSDRILVKMPDGTLIDAPRGVTRAEVEARYGRAIRIARLKASNPAEYDPDSPEFKAKYGATAGMSGWDKAWANVGAGATNLGVGLKQMFTFDDEKEKQIEQEIAEKRARDAELARNTRGGKALQIAGEILPTLAVPAGTVVRGIGAIPKLGAAARGVGIGARALPSMTVEGAVTGAALGALAPTGEGESTLANVGMGALGGALLPGVLHAAGYGVRKLVPQTLLGVPLSKKLVERGYARSMASELGDDAAAAERKLARYQRRVQRGIDEPPMSTAMVTQNPKFAEKELVARASKETSGDWAAFDEALDNARWDILDANLGSAQTVDDAIAATSDFMSKEAPKYLSKIKPAKLAPAVDDFNLALQQKLLSKDVLADPAARSVYGHIAATGRRLQRQGFEWDADTLWRERKTLSGWLSGRPPPGKEQVRAPNLDRYLMDARSAIDATLNRASGNKWSQFLDALSDKLAGEGSQKAGQNIRNAFFDETLNRVAGPATARGTPKILPNTLRKSYARHGKTKFGARLDSNQEDAIRTVLDNVDAAEVIQRAKSTMTGRGGSQTAPLSQRLMAGQAQGSVGEIARFLARHTAGREHQLASDAMLSPEFALRLLRSGRYQLSPLTQKQLMAIAAGTRTALPIEREALRQMLIPEPVE